MDDGQTKGSHVPSREHAARAVTRAAYLRRLRLFHITPVYGRLCRLNLAEVGQQWGEGEWTGRDLWRGGSRV